MKRALAAVRAELARPATVAQVVAIVAATQLVHLLLKH